MAAFPRAYRSSATHRNGGTAGHRRATPSQTTGRTYSDVGTGIHNAKVEGIKEGGELPRLCNFIAESAIRFLSKLSCRWRRSYRAAHQKSSLPITPERGNVMRKYGGLCRCPTRFSTKPRKRAGTGSPPTCLKRMRGWRSKPSRLSKGEGACRGKRRSACARYGFLGKRLGDVPSERVGECHAGGWVALRRSKICTVEPLR
mgnify:CR=1 FL=1